MPKSTFYNLKKEKREKIEEALKKEFSENIFEKASVSNIIEKAGIPRGSFYQYFEDKEDASKYIIKKFLDNVKKEIKTLLTKNDGDIFDTTLDLYCFLVDRNYNETEVKLFQNIINKLRFNEESSLFAVERDKGLESIIGNIYQSFDGQDIYKSIEEKGANFLYLIVKNHVFTDGNKRIAATLFIYFLNFYGILYKNERQVIDNNTLAALTLLIAESNPKEKDVIIDLVMNFLNNEWLKVILATLLVLRSIEYKKSRENSSFILTVITAVFLYVVVIYNVFIA